jgi:hypothetical protein
MNEGFKSKIRLVRLFRLRTTLSGLTCYMLGAERAANEGDLYMYRVLETCCSCRVRSESNPVSKRTRPRSPNRD